MVIDGLSSLGALDPASAGITEQLAAYRASGLSAIHQTVGAAGNTPGRFEESLRRIARYQRFIQALPDHLMQIRPGAALRPAQPSGRLGVIFGFQDSLPLGTAITLLDIFAMSSQETRVGNECVSLCRYRWS